MLLPNTFVYISKVYFKNTNILQDASSNIFSELVHFVERPRLIYVMLLASILTWRGLNLWQADD